MNKVILSGGLTRDPEIRYTQSGKAVATFSIGVQRGWKKAENSQYPLSDYFNIVAWDKTAEFCSKYLTKGTKVMVEGRLQSRSYEAQDGSKRYVTEVIANEIEFAGSKRSGAYDNDANYGEANPSDGSMDFLDEVKNKREGASFKKNDEPNVGTEDVPF